MQRLEDMNVFDLYSPSECKLEDWDGPGCPYYLANGWLALGCRLMSGHKGDHVYYGSESSD